MAAWLWGWVAGCMFAIATGKVHWQGWQERRR